ncbi:hypothetical protein TNCV_1458161 [Trichonephila clavipes]|nr:hypothetical protein TNCV_1458161 [Trichonephila clavipes]
MPALIQYLDHWATAAPKITWSVAKSPRVAEQCDVNIQSINQSTAAPSVSEESTRELVASLVSSPHDTTKAKSC